MRISCMWPTELQSPLHSEITFIFIALAQEISERRKACNRMEISGPGLYIEGWFCSRRGGPHNLRCT